MTAAVDASILEFLARRGVTEARHFTTNRGLLGALRVGSVVSRSALAEEDILGLIAINNCYRRWGKDWFDHVSLSIQRINGHLYGISSGRWHAGDEGLWWCVLGFDHEVLAHPNVVFTTTNNGYYSVVSRAKGLEGLQATFADEVTTYRGSRPQILSRASVPQNQPTDPEAEALYPRQVSTDWLASIYVPQPHLAETVHGYLEATGHSMVEIICDPEAFA